MASTGIHVRADMQGSYRFSRWLFTSMSAFALACGLIQPAQASDVAGFYKGKTVELISGASEGGTYTGYARAIAPYLTKHLPGNENANLCLFAPL